MKVAICDDNTLLTEKINTMLSNYNSDTFETYTYYNPIKLIKQLDTVHFDFFILDIEMDEMNGIDLAKIIRERDILSPIVFLTSYKEYMEEVFQIQTFDYLLKPPTEKKVHHVLDKLTQYIGATENYFVFSINKVTHRIPMRDIIYFEKEKRLVLIHTINETYKSYMSTKEVNEQLNGNFVQIHSSFIINCSYIQELRNNLLLLTFNSSSIELPISRRFKTTSQESIIMYMRGRL